MFALMDLPYYYYHHCLVSFSRPGGASTRVAEYDSDSSASSAEGDTYIADTTPRE